MHKEFKIQSDIVYLEYTLSNPDQCLPKCWYDFRLYKELTYIWLCLIKHSLQAFTFSIFICFTCIYFHWHIFILSANARSAPSARISRVSLKANGRVLFTPKRIRLIIRLLKWYKLYYYSRRRYVWVVFTILYGSKV